MTAYRASYLMHVGEIPDGAHVCHRCDNPMCVNPGHLWLGNQAENMGDMISKGRRASFAGEKHGQAKLTKDEVKNIRAEYVPRKTTLKTLAARYKVSVPTIHRIILGKAWL